MLENHKIQEEKTRKLKTARNKQEERRKQEEEEKQEK